MRPSDGRITATALAGEYLAGRVHFKPKSVESLRSLLDAQVLPRWGCVPLNVITPSAVQSWVGGLSAAGLSSSGRTHVDAAALLYFAAVLLAR